MRHKISMLSCIAALLALNWLAAAPCRADDDDSPGAKPAKKESQHDPAASAFTIPYGTVLNDKQQAEYDRLRSDKESELRDAYAAVDQAKSAAEKATARKVLADLRADVRAAMRKIIAMPQREAQAGQQHNSPQAGNATPAAGYEGNYSAGYPGSYGYMSGGVPLVAYANWPTFAGGGYSGGGYGGAGYGNYWPGYYYPPFNKGEGKLINRPLDKSHRTNGAAGKTTPSHTTAQSHH